MTRFIILTFSLCFVSAVHAADRPEFATIRDRSVSDAAVGLVEVGDANGNRDCNIELANHDGSFENGYAIGDEGVAPPYYGAFAECFHEGSQGCNLTLFLTQDGTYAAQTLDVYLWADDEGQPGEVLAVIGAVLPDSIATWPSISPVTVDLAGVALPEGSWWAGYWPNWPGETAGFYVAADENGSGGCPMVNLPAGSGLPAGWYPLSDFFPDAQGLGISMNVVGTYYQSIGSVLPDLAQSAAAWGDFDRDNDLDVLLLGDNPTTGPLCGIYEYVNGSYTLHQALPPARWRGAALWADFDGDGDLDAIVTGATTSGGTPQLDIFRNLGGSQNFLFDHWPLAVPAGVQFASADAGDYDNDGDLDILLTGRGASGTTVSQVWRNGLTGFVLESTINLPAVESGVAKWGDYDKDGDLDVVLAGNGVRQIHDNNGVGGFSLHYNFPPVWNAAAVFGDFDHDGLLGLLYGGLEAAPNPSPTAVVNYYRPGYVGNWVGASLYGIDHAEVAAGDYDNDGRLDALVTGLEGSSTSATMRVYRNQVPQSLWPSYVNLGMPAFGIMDGSVAFGDYDNDMDLDILATGEHASTQPSTLVYQLWQAPPNAVPSPPPNLRTQVNGTDVTFIWDPAADSTTPALGLTYNLRIGTTPLGSEIMPGMANPVTGHRDIAALGNAQKSTSWTIKSLTPGTTYYWAVQSIDAAFAGSPFTVEKTFSFVNCADVGASVPNLYPANGAWGDYDDDGDLDLLIMGFANASGSQCGVYNYNNGAFSPLPSFSPPRSGGDCLWADVNNDGWLDAVVTGYSSVFGNPMTTIHINSGPSGSFTFSDLTGVALPIGIFRGSIAAGDYDNDGDLDLAIGGVDPNLNIITQVYEQDNTGGFVLDVGVSLPGRADSTIEWGDDDNDGDLDLLLGAGEVFRNTNGTFSQANLALPQLGSGPSGAWGDYDADGDLDILMAGEQTSSDYAGIWYNTGQAGGYTYQPNASVLAGVQYSEVDWGDYDHDGDLDAVVGGMYAYTASRTDLYTSNGGVDNAAVFTPSGIPFAGVTEGSIDFGDIDDDRDLDLLTVSDAVGHTHVYRCIGATPNTIPNPPTGVIVTNSGPTLTTLTFSWNAATDAETPTYGLSYNIRIGTTPSGSEVMSSMANATTGHRQVAARGNAQNRRYNREWTITPPMLANEYYYCIQSIDGDYAGSPLVCGFVMINGSVGVGDTPVAYVLAGNLPNPFNPSTQIRYSVPEAGRVEIVVYDVAGRRVRTLVDDTVAAGSHEVQWDGRDDHAASVASGVYLYRMRAGTFTATKRMVLAE